MGAHRAAVARLAVAGAVIVIASVAWLQPWRLPRTTPALAEPPPPLSITDWQFSDPNNGWVLLSSETDPIGRLFATSDAGAHWRALAPWGDLEPFSFHFFDSRAGVVQARDPASRSALLYTSDGGGSWRTAQVPPVSFAPGDVTFAGPDKAFLFSSSPIYVTSDAGHSWQLFTPSGLPLFPRLLGFRDERTGWAEAGTALYRTDDAGSTWTAEHLPSPLDNGLYAERVSMAGTAVMVVTADLPGAPVTPVVYPSRDGGETWDEPRPAQPPGPLISPVPPTTFADYAHWFVPAGRDLWSTSDCGRSWRFVRAALPAGVALGQVRFTSALAGFASTTEPPTHRPVLLRTTDGGGRWTEVKLPRLG